MSTDFARYDRHFTRMRNTLPDWAAAERAPAAFACRKPWLPSHSDARILDFGCGWGHQLLELWCAGYRNLEGVELVEEQAAIVEQGVGGRFPVHCMDGCDFLRVRPQSFDVIVLNDVIEHVPPSGTAALVSAIFGGLRNGGTVVIRTPNMASLFAAYSRYIDVTHCTGFTEFSLMQVLEKAGFVDCKFVSDYNWHPSRWRPWRPFQHLGLQALANNALHRCLFAFRKQTPRPSRFGYNLEVYATKPVEVNS